MNTIEIDFDVFKALTNRRANERVTYNDVLRSLLALPERNGDLIKSVETTAEKTQAQTRDIGGAWISKGVAFPEETEFRATYKGQAIYAKIAHGKLLVDNQVANSPSDAARIVTGNSVNGWTFWKCRLPNESRWRSLESMR